VLATPSNSTGRNEMKEPSLIVYIRTTNKKEGNYQSSGEQTECR